MRGSCPQSMHVLQEEFDCHVTPAGDSKRHDFVRTAVGSGFAAAVLPVAAQMLAKTDAAGLLAGEVSIPVGSFKMPACRAARLAYRLSPQLPQGGRRRRRVLGAGPVQGPRRGLTGLLR